MSEEKLRYTFNRYGDIIIDPTSLVTNDEFHCEIIKLKTATSGAIWLEIPYRNSSLIPIAIENGFKGHHCTDTYFMLTLWLGDENDVKIPNFGTHIVRVQALLLREDPNRPKVKQVLVVREKFSHCKKGRDWKLLSGAVEPGEFIDQAIVREVREEVGLRVKFCTVVGHGNRISIKFGRNEVFFCCQVMFETLEDERKSDQLILQDNELAEAKWMDINDAIQREWQQNYKLRGLEKRCLLATLRNKGLVNFVSTDSRGPPLLLVFDFVCVPHHELGRFT